MRRFVILLLAAVTTGLAFGTIQVQAQSDEHSFTYFVREYERLALDDLRRQAPDAKLRSFYLGEVDSSAACEGFLSDVEGAYQRERRLGVGLADTREQAQRNLDQFQRSGMQFEYAAYVGGYVELCDDNTLVAVTCGCAEASTSCLAFGAAMQMERGSCQWDAGLDFDRIVQNESSFVERVFSRHRNTNSIDLRQQ